MDCNEYLPRVGERMVGELTGLHLEWNGHDWIDISMADKAAPGRRELEEMAAKAEWRRRELMASADWYEGGV